MLNKIFNMLVFVLLFSSVNYGLIISEVMYHPINEDSYNEWIEIYTNETINIENLTLCGKNILPGFLDRNNSIIFDNDFVVKNASFFIITDGGTGSDMIYNYNISNKTYFFHVDSNSLCDGLSNLGKEIVLNFNNINYSFDYSNTINDPYPSFYDFNISKYSVGCKINGTPGFFETCKENEIEVISKKDLDFNFHISSNNIYPNEKLFFLGNITSSDNTTANLIIKIGKKSESGFEYPDSWVVFNKEIYLEKGINNLESIIGNVFWQNNENLLSDNYKAYANLKTDTTEKRPYEMFYFNGKGNVFLINSSINIYELKNNETLNLKFEVLNNESEKIVISPGFIIENFKTLNGLFDYKYYCDFETITNNSKEEFLCSWNETKDTIIGNYTITPFIEFQYSNETITKKNKKIDIIIDGLIDLGEPIWKIVETEKSSFGKFSKIMINYESNNYNKELKFLVYGYPKQIVSDYDFVGVKANDYDSNSLTNYYVKRNKDYFLGIPFLFKPNCDNYYENNVYRLRVRIFENIEGDWKAFDTKDFNVSLNGRNEYLCPKKITSLTSKSITGITGVTETKQNNIFVYGDVEYIINIPKKINDEFFVEINYSNRGNKSNFFIESYLYSGKKLSENNKIMINLEDFQSGYLKLKNKVIPHDLKDEYKIMIKINSSIRKSIKSYSESVDFKIQNNKIENFYTLQKTHNDFIKLYASTNNNEGKLELLSDYDTVLKNADKKVLFEEKLFQGINTYFLILKDKNNNSLDVKKLVLFSDGEKVEIFDNQEIIVGFNGLNQEKESDKGILITGNSVSPLNIDLGNAKLKKLINILLVFIFIIGIFHFWRRLF